MLRIVDGVEWNWLFVEPDGRAPWVLNEDTSERSFEVLGAYGRPVYASAAGASWQDARSRSGLRRLRADFVRSIASVVLSRPPF